MKRLLYLPLWAYGAVYLFGTVAGVVLLLWGPENFTMLLRHFTGIQPYWLSPENLFIGLVLVFAAPALLALGYFIGARRSDPVLPAPVPEEGQRERWAVLVPLLLSSGIALASLARSGAFGNVSAWLDYRNWVYARWRIFDTLSFWEFVNIYNIVPIATAVSAVWWMGRAASRRSLLIGLLAICTPVLVVDFLLFQKKTLIVSLFLVALSVFLCRMLASRNANPRSYLLLTAVGGLAYLLYMVTVALPSAAESSRAMPLIAEAPVEDRLQASPSELAAAPPEERPEGASTATALPKDEPAPSASPKSKPVENIDDGRFRLITSSTMRAAVQRFLPGRWIGGRPGQPLRLPVHERKRMVFFYVAMGPVIRAPVPALIYPVVYPDKVSFAGFDAGLDVLGLGYMPDDNLYIHRKLWPRIEGGSIMVPFQFVVYSQIGLGGALLASFVAGWLLAKLWLFALALPVAAEVWAPSGATVIVLAIYWATDSLRNSLSVSYGLVWAALALLCYVGLFRLARSKAANPPRSAGRHDASDNPVGNSVEPTKLFKARVQAFWDRNPCGTRGNPHSPLSPEFYRQIEKERDEREPFIARFARWQEWKGKRVLELGIGAGTDFIRFAHASAKAVGMDISSRSVELADCRLKLEGLTGAVLRGDIEKLPFAGGKFSLVYSWGAIHHTESPEAAVSELLRVLKPGGRFCVMLYHRHSLVCLQAYLVYGLLRGRPLRSLDDIAREHLESYGTKIYSESTARKLFNGTPVKITHVVTPYDLRIGRHRFLPAFVARFVPSFFGYFMVIEGQKAAEAA